MLVCGIALIPLAWRLEQARKQQEAVAWVHEMDGTVSYAGDDGSVELNGPQWLRKWLGRDFFDDLADCQSHDVL